MIHIDMTGSPVVYTPGMCGVRGEFEGGAVSQSVSQLFHGPAPRSPLHRLAVRRG